MVFYYTRHYIKYYNSNIATLFSIYKDGFIGFLTWVSSYMFTLFVVCGITAYFNMAALFAGIVIAAGVITYPLIWIIDEEILSQKEVNSKFLSILFRIFPFISYIIVLVIVKSNKTH